MQKTFMSDKIQKSTASHIKRYSEHDLRTNRLDRLLLTQASLLSQQKIKTLKTKLPLISATSSFSQSHTPLHSHGRLQRLRGGLGEMGEGLKGLRIDLQEIQIDFEGNRKGLEDKLQKMKTALDSKVGRLGEMVRYATKEAEMRTQRLNEDIGRLREGSATLGARIREAKTRMDALEHGLGVYTGEDKHFT